VLPPPAVPSEAAPAQQLIQYGYVLDLPAGWAHTGGLPERRRSLLTPLAAPDGSDLISVELAPVGYDTGAELRRAHTELKAAFDAAVADGAPLSGFADDASYAGRPVVVYQDSGDADVDVTVDWYVVLDGAAQLSVGCRHTGAGARDVAAACAAVVRSLRRVA
jgi:type VII secretion-associated protein (TIGR03931 family)